MIEFLLPGIKFYDTFMWRHIGLAWFAAIVRTHKTTPFVRKFASLSYIDFHDFSIAKLHKIKFIFNRTVPMAANFKSPHGFRI